MRMNKNKSTQTQQSDEDRDIEALLSTNTADGPGNLDELEPEDFNSFAKQDVEKDQEDDA